MINLDDIIIGRKSQYLSFPSYDMGFLQALKTYSENSRQIVPVWDHLTAPALEIHSPSWLLKHTTALGQLPTRCGRRGCSVLVIIASRWWRARSWLSPRAGKTHLGSCN